MRRFGREAKPLRKDWFSDVTPNSGCWEVETAHCSAYYILVVLPDRAPHSRIPGFAIRMMLRQMRISLLYLHKALAGQKG